jgi:hypothetical protein
VVSIDPGGGICHLSRLIIGSDRLSAGLYT